MSLLFSKASHEDFAITVFHQKSLLKLCAEAHLTGADERLDREHLALPWEDKVVVYAARLWHLDEWATTEEAGVFIRGHGRMPAGAAHLLTFESIHPGHSTKFPIVALESFATIGSQDHVLCLIGDEASRDAVLVGTRTRWEPCTRFLTVNPVRIR